LCFGNIPTGRIVEDDFCPAVILDYAACDAKLPTARQITHCPFVALPDQHRKRLARILTLAPNRESPCMDHARGFVFDDMESRLEIRIHNAHVLWPLRALGLKIFLIHLLKNGQCHRRNMLVLLCF
jgi:hypothetical protein